MKKGKDWLEYLSQKDGNRHKKETIRMGGLCRYQLVLKSDFESLQDFITSSFRLPLSKDGTRYWESIFKQRA